MGSTSKQVKAISEPPKMLPVLISTKFVLLKFKAIAASIPITDATTPPKKACRGFKFFTRWCCLARMIIKKADGKSIEIVAKNAPGIPATRNPTKVAKIITGPGVTCAKTMAAANCAGVSQLHPSTTSFFFLYEWYDGVAVSKNYGPNL